VYTYEVARRIVSAMPGSFVWRHGRRISQFQHYPADGVDEPGIKARLWADFVGVPRAARQGSANLVFSPTQIDAGWCGSIPHVVTVHDLTPLLFPEYHRRQKVWFRHVLPAILRRSDRIIVPSHSTGRDVQEYFDVDVPIAVIPNGVDHCRFRPAALQQVEAFKTHHGLDEYLLYVGNLFPHKNVPRLIRAHSRSRIDIPLVVAGQGRERFRADLESAVRDHWRRDLVRFLDYVRADEIPLLYSGAMALVFPSLYEGFGLPALEAMACGVPVVASTMGSIPEVVGSAAILVQPNSIDDMATAMRILYEDAEKRRDLARRGLARAKEFTWQRCAERTVRLLQDVLE